MPILDDRGRLFGRVNLVDAFVLALVLALLPLGLVTYRVFRAPPPEILKTDPDTLRLGAGLRLRVEGRNLRPYLRAYVTPAGQPVAFVDMPVNPNEAAFLVERPTHAELVLPAVAPGAYDLYLYDEGREVARRPSAFSVVAPDGQPAVASNNTAVIEADVRFDVSAAVASLMKTGDVDVSPSTAWDLKPAVLTSVRGGAESARLMNLLLTPAGTVTVEMGAPAARLTATMRIGVVRNGRVWDYDDHRHVRAGERFVFATSVYVANGFITRVALVSGQAEKAADRR